MFDWENYWSLEGCVGPTQGLHYPDEVHRFYRPFWKRNVAVDMIESTADVDVLKQYDIVVAPTLIMVKPGVADNLEEYVRSGGRLVTGYMSGIHNEFDLVIPGGYPGPLRELCGLWVEEIDAIAPDATIDVNLGGEEAGDHADGTIVASIIELEGAQTLATYGGDDFYAGTAAATVHEVGDGKAYFIGTALDDAGMSALIDPIIDESGVPTIDAPENVEVMRRYADDGTVFTIVTNTGDEATEWTDEQGVLHQLNPFAVLVLTNE
ncbi:beta-galactosidase [Bifidobacterium canis]|uniref:beta-galactosidase n=1 Tax=Bifidobacterium canis TaxID=2610880 RepID=UPI001FE5F6D3|nr:beta-galactosidase trimerization domain-containing protein [Bifidobacterium canis]